MLSDTQPKLFLIRGGSQESLSFTKRGHTVSVSITETEPVEFLLITEERYESRPLLWIGDAGIEPSEVRTTNTMIEYRWYPHRKSSFFLNHFGTSQVTLELGELSGEPRTFQTFVEVYARKLNAERAEMLLQYLEKHFDDIIQSCFSLTAQDSGADEKSDGFRHARVLMEEAENGLESLKTSLARLRQKKRSRLVPQPFLRSWSQVSYVGEYATHWLTSHPDTLVPSPGDVGTVAIGNRRYTPQVIETEELIEDTNVYENQIIHGYLLDISHKLQQIEAYYREQLDLMKELKIPTDVPIDYQSFNVMRKNFGRTYCESLLEKCRRLQSLCRYSQQQLRQVIPVQRPLRESPKLTSGFHSYPHYRTLFGRIKDWYALGGLDRRLDSFLLGLRTIDKLYEFFCLFRLIEALEKAEYTIQKATHLHESVQPSSEDESIMAIRNPFNKYILSNRSSRWITLYYEPNLSAANSDLSNLVDVRHSYNSKYFYRPDFVLEITVFGESRYILLDAKYKHPSSFGDELPGMVLKYLHGLGSTYGDSSSIDALILLYPKQSDSFDDSWNSYHSKQYNLFSEQPTKPVLGSVSLSLQNSDNSKNSILSSFIAQLINLVQ